jgi:hypothetical protein
MCGDKIRLPHGFQNCQLLACVALIGMDDKNVFWSLCARVILIEEAGEVG